jgi:hypothetical protein
MYQHSKEVTFSKPNKTHREKFRARELSVLLPIILETNIEISG